MGSADRKAVNDRSAALSRFNAWADSHPMKLTPAEAVAAAGRLTICCLHQPGAAPSIAGAS